MTTTEVQPGAAIAIAKKTLQYHHTRGAAIATPLQEIADTGNRSFAICNAIVMSFQVVTSLGYLEDMFTTAWKAGRLTRPQRQRIHRLLLKETLTLEEKACIDRILHAVRRGWLQVCE